MLWGIICDFSSSFDFTKNQEIAHQSFARGVHCAQCGNFKNFPPRYFCKNFVKVTFSRNSFTVNQFDKKIFKWGKISEITTLCCLHHSIFAWNRRCERNNSFDLKSFPSKQRCGRNNFYFLHHFLFPWNHMMRWCAWLFDFIWRFFW